MGQLYEEQAHAALKEGNYIQAIHLYKEALDFSKAKYPHIHCSLTAYKEIVEAMDNLIKAHRKAGNHPTSIALSEELSSWAMEGMEQFKASTAPFLDYGLTQISIAESYQALKEYDKGLKICQELIKFNLDPGKPTPMKYVAKQIVPFAHGRSGKLLNAKGDIAASAKEHANSVAAWQKTLETVKANLIHEELAKEAQYCFLRYEKLQDTTQAIAYLNIALKQHEILMEREPDNTEFSSGVKTVSNTLASYQEALGEYEQAIAHNKRSLKINEAQFDETNEVEYLEQLAAINLKLSRCYQATNDVAASAQYLAARIDVLKQLEARLKDLDYTYPISRNLYNLAKKYEAIEQHENALESLDASIEWTPLAIEKAPENTRRKEWQWIQEFFRYQLLMKLEDYETAHSSLRRLKEVFTSLEELEEGTQYFDHINEIECSQRELAYPDVVALDAEIGAMEEGKEKFEKYRTLIKLLKKKKKKDPVMEMPFVMHTSQMAWDGLMLGEYKPTAKALKQAMRIKPINPYLITNYAPALLFMGKYKKAEKVYAEYYDQTLTPGKKILSGFTKDMKEFEEEGVVPEAHRAKVEEIKGKFEEWSGSSQ